MSLQDLLKLKTKQPLSTEVKAAVTAGEAEIFLPPEFDVDLAQWHALFERYNRSGRLTKTAEAVCRYVLELNPGKDVRALYGVSEVVARGNRFYTTPQFPKEKPSLTVLVIYKAEALRLVPVLNIDRSFITHLVLTYVHQ